MPISVTFPFRKCAINGHCSSALHDFLCFPSFGSSGAWALGPVTFSTFWVQVCTPRESTGYMPPCTPWVHGTAPYSGAAPCTQGVQGGMYPSLFPSQRDPALGPWPRTFAKNSLLLEKVAKERVPLPPSSPSVRGPLALPLGMAGRNGSLASQGEGDYPLPLTPPACGFSS